MTKKRFVKLLMSEGIQRNEAQQIAARYNSRNIPYTRAYSYYALGFGFRRGLKKVARSFENLGEQTKQALRSFAELQEALANAERGCKNGKLS